MILALIVFCGKRVVIHEPINIHTQNVFESQHGVCMAVGHLRSIFIVGALVQSYPSRRSTKWAQLKLHVRNFLARHVETCRPIQTQSLTILYPYHLNSFLDLVSSPSLHPQLISIIFSNNNSKWLASSLSAATSRCELSSSSWCCVQCCPSMPRVCHDQAARKTPQLMIGLLRRSGAKQQTTMANEMAIGTALCRPSRRLSTT